MKGKFRLKMLEGTAIAKYKIDMGDLHNINPYLDCETWLFVFQDGLAVMAQYQYNHVTAKEQYVEIFLSKEGLEELQKILMC